MKINNTITNRTSFTYNKAFHDEIRNKLVRQKKNKAIAATLLELEKESLAMEDKINALEKSYGGVQQPSYQILVDCLKNLKLTISGYFEKYFPQFEYNKKSFEEYSNELKTCTQAEEHYWRSELQESLSVVPFTVDDGQDVIYDYRNTEVAKEVEAKPNAQESKINAIQENTSDILTQYIPTASSPKSLDDVVGLEEIKKTLQEEVIDYFEHPELIQMDKEEYGISPTSTILFYGPPGCGKTYITEALANQSGISMYKMDVSKIGSKFVNQTASNIQNAFDYLEKITKNTGKPVLLFMDEIDSLAINRKTNSDDSSENLKTTSTLLKLVQEAKDKNIIIVAATNMRDAMDDALIDRFETETYFGLPDKNGIKNLLKAKLSNLSKGQNLSQNDEKLDEIANELLGYSNRSVVHILEKSAKLARRNSRSEITPQIFMQAIKECDYEKIKEEKYQKNNTSKKIGFIA